MKEEKPRRVDQVFYTYLLPDETLARLFDHVAFENLHGVATLVYLLLIRRAAPCGGPPHMCPLPEGSWDILLNELHAELGMKREFIDRALTMLIQQGFIKNELTKITFPGGELCIQSQSYDAYRKQKLRRKKSAGTPPARSRAKAKSGRSAASSSQAASGQKSVAAAPAARAPGEFPPKPKAAFEAASGEARTGNSPEAISPSGSPAPAANQQGTQPPPARNPAQPSPAKPGGRSASEAAQRRKALAENGRVRSRGRV